MTKLKPGDQAPNFKLEDVYGNTVSLDNYSGKLKYVVFFRNVNCPFCTIKVLELANKLDDFANLNLQMILFFESTLQKIRSSIYSKKIFPIPVIADPEHVVYQAYGVEKSKLKILSTFLSLGAYSDLRKAKTIMQGPIGDQKGDSALLPAYFVLDEQDHVLISKYGKDMRDYLSLEEIKLQLNL